MNNLEFIQGIAILSKYITNEREELNNIHTDGHYSHYACKNGGHIEEFFFCKCEWITDENDEKKLIELGWDKEVYESGNDKYWHAEIRITPRISK
jgi:hypothetical protein